MEDVYTTAIHAAELVGIIFIGWLNQKIQTVVSDISLKRAEDKAELLDNFNEKHQENRENLNAHILEDKTILGDVRVSLARIEARQKRNDYEKNTT